MIFRVNSTAVKHVHDGKLIITGIQSNLSKTEITCEQIFRYQEIAVVVERSISLMVWTGTYWQFQF